MTARLGMIEYQASGVKGHWNDSHSIWTTDDGDYSIVRRFPAPGVEAGWVVHRAGSLETDVAKRFSVARRWVAEARKRDAGIFPEPKVGPIGDRHEKA